MKTQIQQNVINLNKDNSNSTYETFKYCSYFLCICQNNCQYQYICHNPMMLLISLCGSDWKQKETWIWPLTWKKKGRVKIVWTTEWYTENNVPVSYAYFVGERQKVSCGGKLKMFSPSQREWVTEQSVTHSGWDPTRPPWNLISLS